MENDVLRNKIAPWQEKGRWYHGIIDCSNSTFITSKTDKYILDHFTVATSGTQKVIGPSSANGHIRPIDIKVKYKNMVLPSAAVIDIGGGTVATNGRRTLYVYPTSATAGTCEFWVFCVKDADD